MSQRQRTQFLEDWERAVAAQQAQWEISSPESFYTVYAGHPLRSILDNKNRTIKGLELVLIEMGVDEETFQTRAAELLAEEAGNTNPNP
ncbi:hypothetical protein [Mycobacteroides abscessus]